VRRGVTLAPGGCCLLGVCAALCLPAASPAASPAPATNAATAESAFALSLLGQLGSSDNLVISPYSIDEALTMADTGAAGQTGAQIDGVLHAASESDAAADAAATRSALARAIHSGSGAPTLDVANALWTQTGLAIQAPFAQTLASDFGAPPQSTNFAGAPGAALAAINAWVGDHTGGLIRNLLGQGAVTAQTAFVLANAIYLKAHWLDPFVRSQTAPAPFTTATGQTVRVPFMNQAETSYDYASGGDYQAVELPYSSSSLSLLAILPRRETLAAFQRTLSAQILTRIAGSLAPHGVNLSMPKLDLSTQLDLNGPLAQLGMTDAFGAGANFSALTRQRALSISLVEHAAYLKVDEQGTVATGATAIIAPTAVARPPSAVVDLTLDHPYLLVLRDDASGTILFLARVADPSQS